MLTGTIIVAFCIVVLFVVSYAMIYQITREKALERLQENVTTVMEEVHTSLDKDSKVLNAAAQIISNVDLSDKAAIGDTLRSVDPLAQTMTLIVLLPDETLVFPDGNTMDVSGKPDMDFETLAAMGEHISDRVTSVRDDSLVLRHMVPVVQNGKTAAILYGVIQLSTFPDNLSIRNIYHGRASYYIIDTRTGDFLLDTYPTHLTLPNIADMDTPDRETRGSVDWEEYTTTMMDLKAGLVVYRTPRTPGWEYMYYSPAQVNEWSISISVPESEVLATLYSVQTVFFIAAVLLVLVIVLYVVYLRRQMKKQAEAMVSNAVQQAVLEEKLHKAQAAERAKTAFLPNMSHDIRTPMNAIIGFTTLAESSIEDTIRVAEYLDKIRSSSSHLLSLINDILDMSSIESGKLKIEEKPCSFAEIFHDIRNIVQTQMDSRQLKFRMEVHHVVDEEIFCDKLHVNQILLNLLSNALKFTPAGGIVVMAVEELGEEGNGTARYALRVKDTGIGMGQEFVQHIFEPFERERTSTVSGIQGTGLGMSITKNIVEAMGGTISVETEKGVGTIFTVELTFRLQDNAERALPLSGKHTLVVTRDDNHGSFLCRMLDKLGMQAEMHPWDSHSVLQTQNEKLCDFVLLDDDGEDDSSMEFIQLLHGAKRPPMQIYFIDDRPDLAHAAREAGVAEVCRKPVFLSELREALLAAAAAEKASEETKIEDQIKHLAGTRLLLVEDNELNQEIAVTILEEYGFVIETADDGVEAVEKVSNSQPGYYALVLMDIQMPVMNGYEAARSIRALKNHQLSKIPIVAMTANAFEEDKRKALDSGMNDHVAKPIDVDRLLSVLVEILDGQN